MKFTPENITSLRPSQVFVAGTNLVGQHGSGSARTAYDKFGLKWGLGEGLSGQSYAFPTKSTIYKSLTLEEIKQHISKFLQCVNDTPDKEFLLTKVGTLRAGFTIDEIANLFIDFIPLPTNLVVPVEFYNYWKQNTDKEIYLKDC